MLTTYQKSLLMDVEREVKVKGPATVAEELGISEQCVRELAPEQARAHDEARS